MQTDKLFKARLIAGSILSSLALSIAAPAFAADDEIIKLAPQAPQAGPAAGAQSEDTERREEVQVVTGTRIQIPNLVQATPVVTVGKEELDIQQVSTTEELLRQLPGLVPSIGPAVNNGANGAATVNLRGIGANRNLVLLNGQRITPFGLGAVTDTNNIPTAIIESVDVVTGGATTVYGADAISGAINFKTRTDFEGVELNVVGGITNQGDGRTIRTDFTVGGNFADDRGNAVLSFNYTDFNAVFQGDRDISVEGFSSTSGAVQGSGTTVPTVFLGLPGGTQQFNPATDGLSPVFNTFNFNPFNLFQTPLERFGLFGQATYKLTDDIELFSQAQFVQNSVVQIIAPSGTFFNTFDINLSNPTIPAAVLPVFCADAEISMADCALAAAATDPNSANFTTIPIVPGRRFVEQGPRIQDFEGRFFQFQFGARGELFDKWRWEIVGQYGESDQANGQINNGLFSRTQQALLSVAPGECIDSSNACVPLDLFTDEGGIDPAFFSFINQAVGVQTETSLATVIASVSGDLGETFKSPFTENPIGIAFGTEYRRLTASLNPDLPSATPDEVLGNGAATPPTEGAFDVWEGFFESSIPLVSDVFLVKDLNFEFGLRFSTYSNTGFSLTWKAGGSWEIIDGLRARSVFQRAVRSPNIGELFSPVVTGLDNLAVDPCADAGPVGNAGLTALCIATGAPPSSIGTIPQPSAGQINATSGGNPNLDVERAATFTAGFVFTPPQVKNLIVSIDYFNISLTDAITTPTVGDIIDPCFSAALNPTFEFNEACSLVGRNPLTGGLNGGSDTLGIFQGLSNLGAANTDGLDFGVAYAFELSDFGIGSGFWGNININWNAVWTFENRFQATPSADDVDCVGLFSVNCLPGSLGGGLQPNLQFTSRVTWSFDRYDFSIQHRWLSEFEVEPGSGNFLPAFSTIDARNFVELAMNARVTEWLTATVTIDNIFNADPPNVGNTIGSTAFNSGNTFPTVFDTLGRRFTFGLRARL